MESQELGLGCGVSEDDGHGGMWRQAGTLGSQQSGQPPDSGQHRFMVRSTMSGIRFFETGILTLILLIV